ncbi:MULTISPECIES: FtsK/SpoIIIE domain-containing protein [unclassified Streptomyces]|uniref:FtsK/SpoIIIE domain-containing protein n=1 Tax=unclassified Streptomyces TaxID=2593676 RepID=UPI0035DC8530
MPPNPSHDSILARAALGVASAFGKVCRHCVRRRFELAPGLASAGLTGLAWLHHWDGVSWPEHGAYGAATLAAGALAAGGLKYKHKAVAGAGASALAVMANTWIGAAAGPSAPSLIANGLITGGTYAAYVPWLVRSRRDQLALQVKAAKAGVNVAALGTNTNAPGLTGSTVEETALLRALVALLSVPAVDVTALDYTPFGWQAVVVLPPGRMTAPQKVMARRDQLAANLGLPGKLRLAKGVNDNELIVSLYESDPLAEPISWPGPPAARTCTEPAALGMDAFGQPVLIPLLYNHVLIGGATDNGKSGVQSVLIAHVAACEDAEALLIDMKPGAVEFSPWRESALALADTPTRGMQLLQKVWNEVKRRGGLLAELGEKKWVPGKHGPAWFVFIDELAELMRRIPGASKLIESLLQVARFVGITLVCATQSPSNRVFGGTTDGRQQYQVRIGLGAKESTTSNLIFGPGAYGDGWCLDELDAPGKFLRWDREHQVSVEARAFWMTDEDVAATNQRYARGGAGVAPEDDEPTPDPEGTPTPPTEPTPPSGGPGGGRPLLRAVPTFPDGSEIADERHLALWQAVERAGARGITVDDMVALDLPQFAARSSVNGPLGQWKRKGWIEEAGKQGRAMAFRTVPRQAVADSLRSAAAADPVTVGG